MKPKKRKVAKANPAKRNKIVQGLQEAAERMRRDSTLTLSFTDQPGRGEVVGALAGLEGRMPIHVATEPRLPSVMKSAKRNDDAAVGVYLRAIFVDGMTEGRKETQRSMKAAVQQTRRELRQQIVGEFLSARDLLKKAAAKGMVSMAVSTIEALAEELIELGWHPDKN